MGKTQMRAEARKVWVSNFGPIRKGAHLHHITPLSEGGGNNLGNLIVLHIDDHWLIHKMRGDIKSANFLLVRGYEHSEETKRKIGLASAKNTGWLHTEETKSKISLAKVGHITSKETKSKISKAKMGRQHPADAKTRLGLAWLGRNHSEETRVKMSMNNGSKNENLRKTCPHCSKSMIANYSRYHGDNCKHKEVNNDYQC